MDLESGLLERLKRKERGTAKPGGDHWFPCGVKLKGSSSDSDVTHSLTDRLQLSDEEANDDSFVSDSAVQNVIPDTPSPVFAKRKNCALLHRKSSQEPPGKRVKKLRNQLPSIPKHGQPSSDSEFNDMEKTEDRIAAARAKALQLLKKKRDKMQTKGVTVSHGCDSGSEGATLSEAQRKFSENSSDSDLEPFDAGTFHSRNPRQAKIIALKNDSVSDESSSDLDEKEWEEYMKRLGKIKTSPRAKQNGENSGSGDSSPSLISGSPVKYHKRKSVTKRKRSTEQTGGQNDTNIKDALLFPDEEESSTRKEKVNNVRGRELFSTIKPATSASSSSASTSVGKVPKRRFILSSSEDESSDSDIIVSEFGRKGRKGTDNILQAISQEEPQNEVISPAYSPFKGDIRTHKFSFMSGSKSSTIHHGFDADKETDSSERKPSEEVCSAAITSDCDEEGGAHSSSAHACSSIGHVAVAGASSSLADINDLSTTGNEKNFVIEPSDRVFSRVCNCKDNTCPGCTKSEKRSEGTNKNGLGAKPKIANGKCNVTNKQFSASGFYKQKHNTEKGTDLYARSDSAHQNLKGHENREKTSSEGWWKSSHDLFNKTDQKFCRTGCKHDKNNKCKKCVKREREKYSPRLPGPEIETIAVFNSARSPGGASSRLMPVKSSSGRRSTRIPGRQGVIDLTGVQPSPDPARLVAQVEEDEALARQLQEELDREYARALASSLEEEAEDYSRQQGVATRGQSPLLLNHHQPDNRTSVAAGDATVAPTTSTAPPGGSNRKSSSRSRRSPHVRRRTPAQNATGQAAANVEQWRRQQEAELDREVLMFLRLGAFDAEFPQQAPADARVRTRGRSRWTRHSPFLPPYAGFDQDTVTFFQATGMWPMFEGRMRGPQRFANEDPLDGNDYEELLALGEQLGEVKKKGLTKRQINQLPTKKYKKEEENPTATECNVCFTEYNEGDTLRILNCFHEFHSKCIDRWIKDNPTCPICRVEVKLS